MEHVHDTWQVNFAAQTVGGAYTLTIKPNVVDLAGNKLDQNQNHNPGETVPAVNPPDDSYTNSYTLINPTPVVPPGTTPNTAPLRLTASSCSTSTTCTHFPSSPTRMASSEPLSPAGS